MTDHQPKWVRVEPGTVIPAGQPYRIEYNDESAWKASEFVPKEPITVPARPTQVDWFIDSTYSAPLKLPTKPTWGIALTPKPRGMNLPYDEPIADVGRYALHEPDILMRTNRDYQCHFDTIEVNFLLDFIPLTPEQVARIGTH